MVQLQTYRYIKTKVKKKKNFRIINPRFYLPTSVYIVVLCHQLITMLLFFGSFVRSVKEQKQVIEVVTNYVHIYKMTFVTIEIRLDNHEPVSRLESNVIITTQTKMPYHFLY